MNHEQSTSPVVTTRMLTIHGPASSVVTCQAMGTCYWMAEVSKVLSPVDSFCNYFSLTCAV